MDMLWLTGDKPELKIWVSREILCFKVKDGLHGAHFKGHGKK